MKKKKKKITFDTNLDTFIICTAPILVLIQKQIYEVSSNDKSEHRRAATGEIKYFTLSPGFPLHLKTCALHLGSAQLQHVLPWESARTHVNVHTHGEHRRTHTASQRRNKIPKKGRRNKIWDVFECVLVLHYSVLWHLPPTPTSIPWQKTGRREQSVMWHFAEAFILHNSC